MFHPLARKHIQDLESKRYPLSNHTGFTLLNLNINSLSSDRYTTYPPLRHHCLATQYIQILEKLSGNSSPLIDANVLFTNGSAESIDLILRAFCEPGKDAILVSTPTFPYYGYRALIENLKVISIPLLGEDLNILDIPQLLAQKQAKVLFLCTPSNPLGTLLRFHDIQTLIQEFPGIVVVDEAYIEWTDAQSLVDLVADHPNLIVLRTFSKIWGLAGARAGVTLASPQTIETLSFCQTMFNFSKSTADLIEEKMRGYQTILAHKMQMNAQRQDFYHFLNELPITQKVYPGTANFLLAVFEDEKAVEKRLYDAKILVSNCSSLLPRALRISIGTPEEMKRLTGVLQ